MGRRGRGGQGGEGGYEDQYGSGWSGGHRDHFGGGGGDVEEVEGEGLVGELQGEGNLDLPSPTSGSSPSSSRLMPTFYPATGSKTKRSRHGKTTLIPTSSPSTAMKTISPGTHARGSVRAAVQAKTEKLLPWGTRWDLR